MTVQQIDVIFAKQWLDNNEAVLIDVREPFEHNLQKIVQAKLCPFGTISLDDIANTDKKILIHCQKGMRSYNACEKLLALDNAVKVYNVEGGIEAWVNAGFPVVAGKNKKVLPLDR